MKIGLFVLLSIILVTSLAAFEQGTINAGGSISFESYKWHSDADATTTISFAPQVGYFFMDNIAADLLLNYTSISNDGDHSIFAFGIGGRYFFNQIYGGLGFMMESSDNEFKQTANYLDIKAGYLHPLVDNVFIDAGLLYRMGVGEYGGDAEGDNEESLFKINIGLQIFFPFGK